MARQGSMAKVERGFCSLYLPLPLIEQARAIGHRTGLTRNQVVAIALDDYLARHGQGATDGNAVQPLRLHPVNDSERG